ncbi:DUF4209 domain-containing protein [Thermodesulfovibrio yellowstonii]|uniref:DUF4209 domain-containing protein n=1 Tax=Thermodesulfovibrio yellowstonii (strain ATCC 51303 / DSM 11347 / YP87) TaxID=289376 RepID=B5YJE7_THEYD|nr:DUF4209 domain-containing protein [Thermodesulfovibrio yellowstonii]ACI20965.1 hypothetical protein THEYE_A0519 [Thermodesulfovibrio yellowstonii DSM 11347]MDI6864385.1 DUF4209 domain-containing protein [Thermodesulfovibrio yellowstonii]
MNEEIREFLHTLESSISGTIEEYEISEKIKTFIEEKFKQKPPDALIWELMAFAFIENYQNDESGWGTYFGPIFVGTNKEGKVIEYPSLRRVTSEILFYWEKRAKESKHPILRQRYSNLVWDFSEKIIQQKPHYSIAQIFIDSIIEIAEKDLYKYEVKVIEKLKRALSLALTINDKERIEKLKNTIINYEEKIAEDDKPGLWGFSYELLIKNKKIQLNQEEQRIIKNLEERLERILKGNNHWAAQRAALLLADYYKGENPFRTKDILIAYGDMVQRVAKQASSLVGVSWLEGVFHIYSQYGLKNEANKLLIKIKEISKNIPSEMKQIEVPIEIPKDELEKFINDVIDGDIKTVLQKVAIYYLPKKDKIINQLKNLSQIAPISFLFTRKIIDESGREIAAIGSLEEDIDGHIVFQISQNMQLTSFILREAISRFISKYNISSASIIDYLYNSPLFDERRKEFFQTGIDAYLNGQFLIALHVLIPQIEALIRNLAEMIGLPVLKQSRSGGFNYRTLDELLREDNIKQVFGEDMSLYLRVLFTDPRGWNLRNNVCHGISHAGIFNEHIADRVLHALLCLALVKEKRDVK